MGRPTNAEIAAKKAAEEEKRKADALAQQITGIEENAGDSVETANPEEPQNDSTEDVVDLPEDKPESVIVEPVEDMPESNIAVPTFKADYVIYDHTVKVHGKFYATGERVPVQ